MLKARGFGLPHLVTSTFLQLVFKNRTHAVLRSQCQVPSLALWEMGRHKRGILWLTRGHGSVLLAHPDFPFLPHLPSSSVLGSEGIVKISNIHLCWAASASDQGLPTAVRTSTGCRCQSTLFERMWAVLADQRSVSLIEIDPEG